MPDNQTLVRDVYNRAEVKDVPGWIKAFAEGGTFTDMSTGVTTVAAASEISSKSAQRDSPICTASFTASTRTTVVRARGSEVRLAREFVCCHAVPVVARTCASNSRDSIWPAMPRSPPAQTPGEWPGAGPFARLVQECGIRSPSS